MIEKAVQFLWNNGVNVNDSSLQASREGYEKTMQWLVDNEDVDDSLKELC